MGKRTIKRRKRTIRIQCDHLLYTDEEGEESPLREGQWVEFKRKITSGDMAQMLGFALIGEGDDLDALRREFPAMIRLLARKIVGWNWRDLDGEFGEDGELPALPPPSLETLSELDFDDILNLVEMLSDLTEPAKN